MAIRLLFGDQAASMECLGLTATSGCCLQELGSCHPGGELSASVAALVQAQALWAFADWTRESEQSLSFTLIHTLRKINTFLKQKKV